MGQTRFYSTNSHLIPYFLILSTCLFFSFIVESAEQSAYGIGFINHHSHSVNKLPARWQAGVKSGIRRSNSRYSSNQPTGKNKHYSHKTALHKNPSKQAITVNCNANKDENFLSSLIANLQTKELMPGIIYKKATGALRLNILDIDTAQAPVMIKPIIAPQGTTRLQTVKDHTSSSHAIAAINANYFKNTGVPLGTLIIDGDWVAGPLYDRVALGINKSGFVRIDRVGLGGILHTSNREAPQLWINNINAPRRTGCHTIAYSRRWGSFVRLEYDGCLVSIDAQGKVLSTDKRSMTIPYGGIVLSDSKDSILSALKPGDQTDLHWRVSPESWSDINQAVSGGPLLIKDNQYCINLKAESFHSNWTSNSITARTACGVTANNHLLLVTAEGNHTLYDLAHILHKLGAIEAMNLDGGGSTTMVIHDSTVNMESKSKERRVAVALGIFVTDKATAKQDNSAYSGPFTYVQNTDQNKQQIKESLGIIGNSPEQLENQTVTN